MFPQASSWWIVERTLEFPRPPYAIRNVTIMAPAKTTTQFWFSESQLPLADSLKCNLFETSHQTIWPSPRCMNKPIDPKTTKYDSEANKKPAVRRDVSQTIHHFLLAMETYLQVNRTLWQLMIILLSLLVCSAWHWLVKPWYLRHVQSERNPSS